MNIDELQGQIQAANETAQQASALYSAAKDAAEQLGDQFAGMSAEAVASQMHEVARLLGEVGGIVEEAVSQADEAHTHAEAAKNRLTHDPPRTPASRESASRPPSNGLAGFRPDQRHPAAAAAVRRFGWPRNRLGRVKARGLMYDEAGRPVLHRPLKALRKGNAYPAPDLKQPWRFDPDMATTWHIEGGVAAYMRNTKTKEIALYITLPPCGGPTRPDPKGCHENLAKILPKGYTLYVYEERPDGEHNRTPYVGTGEALI